MKRYVLIVAGIGALSIIMFNMVACSPVREARAIKQSSIESGNLDTSGAPAMSAKTADGTSCVDPGPEAIFDCQTRAEKILASTVRLEFHGPGGGIGHASVVGGRYLITHNHYPVSGEVLERGGDGLISAVSVFKANGDIILLKVPLALYSIVVNTPEALTLDFGEYGAVGFFDGVGIPSADVAPQWLDPIQPGDEVAQIDWNGSTTFVTWALVTAVYTEREISFVELESFVEQGASGGGVYFNGYHVANNWTRNIDRDASTGEVLRQYSVAAINTGSVLSATSGSTGVPAIGN